MECVDIVPIATISAVGPRGAARDGSAEQSFKTGDKLCCAKRSPHFLLLERFRNYCGPKGSRGVVFLEEKEDRPELTLRKCSVGAYGSSCIFNNMRVVGPDRGGGAVAERLPALSQSVPAATYGDRGLPHHITQRGNRREAILVEDGDQAIYQDLLAERELLLNFRLGRALLNSTRAMKSLILQ
jgi:hypothetical protein